MGGRSEGTGVRVRRIIKTASEECASAYPRDGGKQHERKIGHGVRRNIHAGQDYRSSNVHHYSGDRRPSPLAARIRCSASRRTSLLEQLNFHKASPQLDLESSFRHQGWLPREELDFGFTSSPSLLKLRSRLSQTRGSPFN